MSETRQTSELRLHPLHEGFPALAVDQYERLKESIRQLGLQEPIRITPANEVVDGKHRLAIARELKLQTVPVLVLTGEVDALAYAIDSATARRNLTTSGIVLLLFLKHPQLAECRAERTGGRPPSKTGQLLASYRQVCEHYRVPRDYFTILPEIREACNDEEWTQLQAKIFAGEASIPALHAGVHGKIPTKGKNKRNAKYAKLAPKAAVTLANAFRKWTQLEFFNERAALKTDKALHDMFSVVPDTIRHMQADVIVDTWPAHERAELMKALRAKADAEKRATS